MKPVYSAKEYFSINESVYVKNNNGSVAAKKIKTFVSATTAYSYAFKRQQAENKKKLNSLKEHAPDLLEALTELYNAIDCSTDLTPELMQKCAAAIKKATE